MNFKFGVPSCLKCRTVFGIPIYPVDNKSQDFLHLELYAKFDSFMRYLKVQTGIDRNNLINIVHWSITLHLLGVKREQISKNG